ncbi:hypothetical protein BW247_05580 [Acidihalobacter ferrooxydans]|uniref:ATP-grasp domain-containing protein n=2 Tax=Acidihalobacter ferrooxydans TaxID=1765967 RepID=A0A1P8UFL1_9GAMM|nr:hypothetical protein BW247_05580 [Acidihalobacter ferrooxydans]
MRSLDQTTLGKAHRGLFVKPVEIKAFDAIVNYPGFERSGLALPADTPCWCSPVQEWLSEYRVYVLHGKMLGFAQYTGDYEWYLSEPLIAQIRTMIDAWPDAPAAYAMDVAIAANQQLETLRIGDSNYGVVLNGSVVLVEINDGWATGYYSDAISPREYAAWLHARWMEIVHE